MPEAIHDPQLFTHIRILVGMVLGLGITRLLSNAARFVQHPTREHVWWVHLAWVFSMLLMLVHFWWWEFRLFQIPHWTFEWYLFLIFYVVVLYLLCTLLFPDQMDEYAGFRDYFLSRRKWFFGLLALSYMLDFGDTLFKGHDHFSSFGIEYPLRNACYVVVCLVAIGVRSVWFHGVFAVVNLLYQVSWILRQFDTLS